MGIENVPFFSGRTGVGAEPRQEDCSGQVRAGEVRTAQAAPGQAPASRTSKRSTFRVRLLNSTPTSRTGSPRAAYFSA